MQKEGPAGKKTSAFEALGFNRTVASIVEEIQALYAIDDFPWVVGYSGGKDSTAILQLVWKAILGLAPKKRAKKVYVISTDTWVESPIVSQWVRRSLIRMEETAKDQNVPIIPRQLEPEIRDSFWVNLIGRGYPAPRHLFRWCTHRLKIKPSNDFIKNVVRASGEAVLVLGTRKAESSRRHASMKKHEAKRIRERLTPNSSLPNSFIYTPIEDWTNDDVWFFLMQIPNHWGHSHKDLLTMYRGATADGECPLVVDTSTPSCGNSRFGCWVCTLVDRDRSMEAMIQNDEEKEWMQPLLDIRNLLDKRSDEGRWDDRDRREWRRMDGSLQFMERIIDGGKMLDVIPGPYTKEWREKWLRMVLVAQENIRKHGPPEVRDITLLRDEELHEIRRIWLSEKSEFDDSVPKIYQEVTGRLLKVRQDDGVSYGAMEWDLLKDVCGEDGLHFELLARLLNTEREYGAMVKRRGLYEAIEHCFEIAGFESRDEAIAEGKRRREIKKGGSPTSNQEGDIENINNMRDAIGEAS